MVAFSSLMRFHSPWRRLHTAIPRFDPFFTMFPWTRSQVLEGPEESVKTLLAKIKGDARHREMRNLWKTNGVVRRYPGFGMKIGGELASHSCLTSCLPRPRCVAPPRITKRDVYQAQTRIRLCQLQTAATHLLFSATCEGTLCIQNARDHHCKCKPT